jgi:hypothetical protein
MIVAIRFLPSLVSAASFAVSSGTIEGERGIRATPQKTCKPEKANCQFFDLDQPHARGYPKPVVSPNS